MGSLKIDSLKVDSSKVDSLKIDSLNEYVSLRELNGYVEKNILPKMDAIFLGQNSVSTSYAPNDLGVSVQSGSGNTIANSGDAGADAGELVGGFFTATNEQAFQSDNSPYSSRES